MEISKLSEMQLQLLFVLVGGLIGFLSTILVSRIIEKQGRVKLYYKVVFFLKGTGDIRGDFEESYLRLALMFPYGLSCRTHQM